MNNDLDKHIQAKTNDGRVLRFCLYIIIAIVTIYLYLFKLIRSASNLTAVTELQQILYDVETIQRSWSWHSIKLGRTDCNTSSNVRCKNPGPGCSKSGYVRVDKSLSSG